MKPTLYDGQMVNVKYSKKVNRFDVVVFAYNKEDHFIVPLHSNYLVKRVVGIPGDSISIKDGYLYVNGKLVIEEYVKYDDIIRDFDNQMFYVKNGIIEYTYIVPEGYYFVLGDNRGVDENQCFKSIDSREFGLISDNSIIGIVE